MGKSAKNEYSPDYVSLPGDTLAETINSLGMTQVELSKRMGRPIKTINEIIAGKTKITPETAIQLEKVLNIPASFWNNRQRRYDEFLARKKEQESLKGKISWGKNFPIAEMIKLEWLPKTQDWVEKLNNLLAFFGVASPEAWIDRWESIQVSYRKSKKVKSNPYALAAWLQKGERDAAGIECSSFDRAAFLKTLLKIKSLTVESPKDFGPKMVELCAACGVAVVFVPQLPNTASGATRWLNKNKALIQLSFKYGTDDHFWFSFFHEAGHIINHHKKAIFIENKGYSSDEEEEADAFAADMLVPKSEYENFVKVSLINETSIRKFAARLGISPGIVVGRLQHDKHLEYSQMHKLKRKLEWDKKNNERVHRLSVDMRETPTLS